MKKIQFSLLSLVLLSFTMGTAMFFIVPRYLDSVLIRQMSERFHGIKDVVNESILNTGAKNPMAIYGSRGESFWNGNDGWKLTVRFDIRKGDSAQNSNPFAGVPSPILSMNIKCTRSRLRVENVEIDYDNAPGNAELLKAISALCDDKKWSYTARHQSVLEIENDAK